MLTIVNPATEDTLCELPEDAPAAIERKVAGARQAQPGWAALPLARRREAIERFAVLLAEQRDALAATLTSEMGKPIRQSRAELDAMQGRLAFFLEHTARAVDDETVLLVPPGPGAPALEERIRYEPLGVVADISAWNYPWFVSSNVIVPALLTGNAVVFKPSEHATLTGLAMVRLLREAGVPQEVIVPVLGAGAAGAALLDAAIDAVFFTGSWATGRRIAAAAAGRLLRVQLELGGKDPAYACDDVDVPAAAAALADGAFYNAGQSCCAVERIYVHRRIAAEFLERFLATVNGFVMGDPADEATYLGPLARREQVAVLEDQVRDALARGADLLAGGARQPGRGFFFKPTVLARVSHEMKVMREESFGPIIGIQEVADDDEALALMNDAEYGLTAAVYSADRARAERILARVQAGSAYWNCCDRVSPRLPWSGRRRSGIGTTLGLAGIRAFVQPKSWHLRSPS